MTADGTNKPHPDLASIPPRVPLSPVTDDGHVSHTPGPWRAEVPPFEIYAAVDGLEFLIAEANGGRLLSFDEAEANAELIAAAPELLRLLHAAYGALRSYELGNQSTELAKEVADAIQPLLTRHGSALQSLTAKGNHVRSPDNLPNRDEEGDEVGRPLQR
jgi:hypothetical protein